MSGSNTTGIYADDGNNFYTFNYTNNGGTPTLNSSVLITFTSCCTLSPTFNSDNSKVILTAYNNIALYLTGIVPNCI